jgi:hypothetical protein
MIPGARGWKIVRFHVVVLGESIFLCGGETMKLTRVIRFLQTRSPWVSLVMVAPLVVVILAMTACVKHPIGDPETSKVDPQYSGVWSKQGNDQKILLFMQPYDARTYLVSVLEYVAEGDVLKPKGQQCMKGWLTSIGDSTFLTMEVLSHAYFAGIGEKPDYYVAKLSLTDGVLHWRLVDGHTLPAKSAQDSAALEKVIRENLDADALYVNETFAWAKCQDKTLIEDVLKAFGFGD